MWFHCSRRKKVCFFVPSQINEYPHKICVHSIFNIVLITFHYNQAFGQNSFPLYYYAIIYKITRIEVICPQ